LFYLFTFFVFLKAQLRSQLNSDTSGQKVAVNSYKDIWSVFWNCRVRFYIYFSPVYLFWIPELTFLLLVAIQRKIIPLTPFQTLPSTLQLSAVIHVAPGGQLMLQSRSFFQV